MQLKEIYFKKENIRNEYASYNNQLSPKYDFDTEEHNRIYMENEARLLEIVRKEIYKYVNDPFLCCDDEGMFPKPFMMTGEWYISRIWFAGDFLEIETRFVGISTGRKDDYLGLNVNFIYQKDEFMLNGIDSESI